MSEADLSNLFSQLNNIIAQLDTSSVNDFLHDLLGKEERIMLAKRLTIVIMITESFSSYQIAKKLKVSTSTVESIRTKHKNGSFDRLLHILGKDKKMYMNLWETLDNILHLGGILPHYNGLDRYKNLSVNRKV